MARLLLSSPVLVDLTFRFPLGVDIRASGVAVVSTLTVFCPGGAAGVEEGGSPSGTSAPGVSVDSSIGGVGMGVLEGDVVLKEFKFNLLRL